MVLLLSKEHRLAQKSQIVFRDLAKEKFILAPPKVTVYMIEIIYLYTQEVGHDIKSKQPIKLKNSLALIYRKDNTSQIVRNFQRAIQDVCQASILEE